MPDDLARDDRSFLPRRRSQRATVVLLAAVGAASLLACSARTGGGATDRAPERAPAEPVESRGGDFGTGPQSAWPRDTRDVDESALDARRRAALVEERLEDVFFAFDSSRLTYEMREVLARDARVLLDNPGVHVILEGHCDERGTNEYNLALGERRARSVRDYLAQSGVAVERMRIVSYGEEQPFALGHDEAAWAQNRRVHFRAH